MTSEPPISADSVHIWLWSLDTDPTPQTLPTSDLSLDERARADRYQNPIERQRFVGARSGLRRILATYLQCAPADVAIAYGPNGKPVLPAGHQLHFNLSHTGSTTALAVSPDNEIGIDIEYRRPIAENLDAVFTPGELAEIAATEAGDRDAAVLRCWTRKEAIIKALGDGFAHDILSLEVSSARDDASIRRIGRDAGPAAAWSLHHIEPAPDIIGTLAVKAPALRIKAHALHIEWFGAPGTPLQLA